MTTGWYPALNSEARRDAASKQRLLNCTSRDKRLSVCITILVKSLLSYYTSSRAYFGEQITINCSSFHQDLGSVCITRCAWGCRKENSQWTLTLHLTVISSQPTGTPPRREETKCIGAQKRFFHIWIVPTWRATSTWELSFLVWHPVFRWTKLTRGVSAFLQTQNMRPVELLMGTTGSQGDIWTPTPDFPLGSQSTDVVNQAKEHKDFK